MYDSVRTITTLTTVYIRRTSWCPPRVLVGILDRILIMLFSAALSLVINPLNFAITFFVVTLLSNKIYFLLSDFLFFWSLSLNPVIFSYDQIKSPAFLFSSSCAFPPLPLPFDVRSVLVLDYFHRYSVIGRNFLNDLLYQDSNLYSLTPWPIWSRLRTGPYAIN